MLGGRVITCRRSSGLSSVSGRNSSRPSAAASSTSSSRCCQPGAEVSCRSVWNPTRARGCGLDWSKHEQRPGGAPAAPGLDLMCRPSGSRRASVLPCPSCPEPVHDRSVQAPRVPVARQPPNIRQKHRIRHPDPLEAPSCLAAGQAGDLERFRVLRLDPFIGADIDDHRRAVRAAYEVVRSVPTLPLAVVPVQPERCEAIPATSGSKSISRSRSRSSHDSKPTCCPVVAAQYQPEK